MMNSAMRIAIRKIIHLRLEDRSVDKVITDLQGANTLIGK